MTTAWCRVADIHDIGYREWLGGSWALAFGVGLLLYALGRHRGRSGWESAGLAVMTVPVWLVALDVLPDMARTFCAEGNVVSILPGRAPMPPSSLVFSIQYTDAILRNLGYLVLGGILVALGRTPGWWRRPTVGGLARSIAGLLPMGRGETAALRAGAALFPILVLANLVLAALTGIALRAADKSAYYTNMTPYHALMLALAAGFGEELVFRGVMQQGILRLARKAGAPPLAAVVMAVALQAVPFAYTHAGYGNAALLLFAFLFAALAGVAAQWLGIWAAIALHALIDFYVFFLGVPAPGLAFYCLVGLVSVAVLAVAVWEGRRVVQRLRPRGA